MFTVVTAASKLVSDSVLNPSFDGLEIIELRKHR